jgi:hypothetical protein
VKIDIGPVSLLHFPTVVEAPNPEIFIGIARRPDPGPPTTEALRRFLADRERAAELGESAD